MDFPNCVTVYSYFVKWRTPGEAGVSALELALTNQVCAARQEPGRSAEPTLLIVDTKASKTRIQQATGAMTQEKRSLASSVTSQSIRKGCRMR